jgi:hypothetical protein
MNVKDTSTIRNILIEAQELNEDFSYYLCREESFDWPEEKELFPENWTWEIFELNDKVGYDSYGYGFTDSAYLILKVSDGTDEQLYYIPGSYASYDGWNWDISAVRKTAKTEKTILVWSSVDETE